MRDLKEELEKIIKFAEDNDNIRALVLQGSFIDDNATLDDFSDLDPLFFVRDVTEFTENDEWKKHFGNPISFFSDEGEGYDDLKWYTRLTLFDDGFKIDFGFESVKLAKYANEMPLYKVYLDKDNILPIPEVTDDRKFYVKRPQEQEYLDILNEFFFDSSYIVKSLSRNEIFFEKYMESILQKKYYKLLEWYIGAKYEFKVNTGSHGRYFKKYLSEIEWQMLLKTYANGNINDCSKALLNGYELVRYLGTYIADKLGFNYPIEHDINMFQYCKTMIKKYNL